MPNPRHAFLAATAVVAALTAALSISLPPSRAARLSHPHRTVPLSPSLACEAAGEGWPEAREGGTETPSLAPPVSLIDTPLARSSPSLACEAAGEGWPEAGAGGTSKASNPASTPAPPSRSDRIAAALRADGATAARLLPAILDWGPGLSDGQAYDVALAIARESRQRALRPELVAALIRVESAYDPAAASPTNDHGLMQLHGDPVYDIARNVALGCLELSSWRSTYGGGERDMLAHYNGGCDPPPVSWSYADRVLALAQELPHDP